MSKITSEKSVFRIYKSLKAPEEVRFNYKPIDYGLKVGEEVRAESIGASGSLSSEELLALPKTVHLTLKGMGDELIDDMRLGAMNEEQEGGDFFWRLDLISKKAEQFVSRVNNNVDKFILSDECLMTPAELAYWFFVNHTFKSTLRSIGKVFAAKLRDDT